MCALGFEWEKSCLLYGALNSLNEKHEGMRIGKKFRKSFPIRLAIVVEQPERLM